jgi:hypothetical protein
MTKVKSGDDQVLVEPTGTLFWRPLDVLLGCPESSKRFLEKKIKINKYLLLKKLNNN